MYNLFLELDNDGNVENVYSIEVFLSRFVSLLLQSLVSKCVVIVFLFAMVMYSNSGQAYSDVMTSSTLHQVFQMSEIC